MSSRSNGSRPRLRLFAIKDMATDEPVTGDDGEILYFTSKRRAKAVRNQIAHDTKRRHGVILGPDHKRARQDEQ